MNDQMTPIAQLKARMAEFVARRDWQKYHRPKNLAMSLAIEAGELMEHFQWLTHEEADSLLADPAAKEQVSDELADVLAFVLSLANAAHIDLAEAFERKMAKNEVKYPPEQVRGQYRRPNQRQN
jgi:dCTP diphosphatase